MKLTKFKKLNFQSYKPGKYEIPSLKKTKKIIKLSANESALGPSPKAIKEFNKVSKNLQRYPDSEGVVLKNILAKK